MRATFGVFGHVRCSGRGAMPSLETTTALPPVAAPAPVRAGAVERKLFGEDGFTFADALDVVNPLQHIPVVDTLYRDLTSDEIAPGPRVLGDGIVSGLLGTGFGLLATLANVVVEEWTGRDVGEHVLSWFRGEGPAEPAPDEAQDRGSEPAGDGVVPAYLEIAAIADREVERVGSAAPAAAVRAREELRIVRDASDRPAGKDLELARALAAYRAAHAVEPWILLADRVR